MKDHGILVEGRVQFVTLHAPDNGLLTIINVYAPQTPTERALLWNRIAQADFTSDHIILGGDFNHHETSDQENTLGSRRMHRREAAAWHRMTLRYGLTDAWLLDNFHKQSEKVFTYDNGRAGRQSALSRIDKFMVSQTVEERGGRIEVAASMRKLTDHSPVCIKIWGSLGPSQNTPGYFDVSLLSDEQRKKDMLEAWIGEAPLPTIDQNWAPWLEAATERTTQCNQRLSKERKRAQGAQIRSCTKKILLAEIQLQTNPTDEEIRGILSDSQSKLTEVFQNSVERNRHLSASNWLRYGDTCSKAFFDFHRAGNKRSLLRELEIEGGTISGQNDLTQYITEFYTRLYSSDTNTPGTEEAKQRCWTSVPTKVSGEINETLTRQLTLNEIFTAIKALPKGKAPRNDGLPMEFFHECAEETAPVLLQAFTAMLGNGRASAEINKGVITLIPKSGDRAKLSNWRPITLLGSTYKVLAKVLAGRIKAALTHIIRPNQTGFVEGRSIIDNTFMAQEALEWAKESEQDLVLLLLDFEKAFDRIEWGFLFSALAKLGFNET
jgi:hypothetical protein